MAFLHRAYLFDLERFDTELRAVLADAMRSNDPAPLRLFIEQNLSDLKDPYAGEPLDAKWEDLLETRDVQEYGDFAMTRYYDPAADIGLGDRWPALQDLLIREAPPGTDLTLGDTIGPPNRPFDPGGMGAYVVSNEVARNRLETLRELSTALPALRQQLTPLVILFAAIADSEQGAYVAF